MKSNSISSETYLSILYRVCFARRWWLLLLPVVACLALIIVDIRFAYLAVIVAIGMLMIALPVIYYYALTPESRWSILEKEVKLTEGGLHLVFTSEKMQEHLIKWDEIQGTAVSNNCLILRFKNNNYTFLAIPLDSFDGEDELRKFVIEVRKRIASKKH